MTEFRRLFAFGICGLGAPFVAACGNSAHVDAAVPADMATFSDANVASDSGDPLDAAPPPADATPDEGASDAHADSAVITPCEFTLPSLSTQPLAGTHRFDRPVFLTHAPGLRDTVFVVEAAGQIQRVQGTTVSNFLDIRSEIGPAPVGTDERGLLGLAFHPEYAANGRFFVAYTPTSSGFNIVAEYRRRTDDPDRADPTEVRRLVRQPDPEPNHNGGMIGFGPDGFLYVSMGDGGSGGDPHGAYGNALDLGTLLGKILRLDVDAAGSMYAAAGNPFSGDAGLPQIWAYGLRNPWRWSFDRMTGDLYIADVGQGDFEEIDVQPRASRGGENYGWRAYEGLEVYSEPDVVRVPLHVRPIATFPHSSEGLLQNACSITGGYVYRGTGIPDLQGVYVFGDYCSTNFAALRWCGPGSVSAPRAIPVLSGSGTTSFGEDADGELYIVALGGRIRKLVAAP